MTIVNLIGEAVQKQGLNIKQFADKADIAYNTAHDLYTGRFSRIGLDVLDRVCRVLQLQPGELLVWIEDTSHITTDKVSSETKGQLLK